MQPLGARCTRETAAKIGAIPVLDLPQWVARNGRYDATRMDFIELRVELRAMAPSKGAKR